MTAKKTPLLLTLPIIYLSLAACSLLIPSATATSTPAVQAPQPQVATATPLTIAATATQPPVATATEPPIEKGPLEIRLMALEGSFQLRRSGSDNFVTLTQAENLGVGDIIITSSNGIVLISFIDNAETLLYPNSTIVINSIDINENESMNIELVHCLGRAFHRINFQASGSTYKVVTPNGVVTAVVQGTAYVTEILYDLFVGLSIEAIAAVVNSTAFSSQLIGIVDSSTNICAEVAVALAEAIATALGETLAGPAIPIVLFDVASNVAIITYINSQNQAVSVTLEPRQLLEVLADGTATVSLDTRGCGDLICDAYLNEDVNSCPIDCGAP